MNRFSEIWSNCAREWFSLFPDIGGKFVLFLLFSIPVLLLAPGYLIILPLCTYFFPNARWSIRTGNVVMIVTQVIGIFVIFSSLTVVRSLERRYHSKILCQVCGRPGNTYEYASPNSTDHELVYRVLCDEHLPKGEGAPKSPSNTSTAELMTPGNQTTPIVALSAIFWILATLYSRALNPKDAMKSVIVLTPVLLIALGLLMGNFKFWVLTLFHP